VRDCFKNVQKSKRIIMDGVQKSKTLVSKKKQEVKMENKKHLIQLYSESPTFSEDGEVVFKKVEITCNGITFKFADITLRGEDEED